MHSDSGRQEAWISARPLLYHQWDREELVLVYHPSSGDTHLLDLLSAEVLRLLGPEPCRLPELWQQLLAQTGLTPEEFPLDRLRSILTQLEQLDLIERVSA